MHETPYLNSNCVAKLGPSLTNNLSCCPQFGRGVIMFPAQKLGDERHGHLSNLNNPRSYNLRYRDKEKQNKDVANIHISKHFNKYLGYSFFCQNDF